MIEFIMDPLTVSAKHRVTLDASDDSNKLY